MKKNALFFLIFLSAAILLKAQEKLSPEHRNWLETVSPIITKTEREVFLKLKTAQERDKFIQLFWKRRDPQPDTEKNEFYDEYMKRVQFADLNFGHEGPRKGSRTERGYFYLLLGPPLERQVYATSSEIWPLELWQYKGEQEYGLPPFFYLIFYQPEGLGEYRLYYPGVEGPEKLVIPSLSSRSLNRTSAYQIVKKVSSELANASLSYIPGESTLGISGLSSDTVISSAYSLAEKKFSDAYARNFLYYKDYVETDYTHNFVENNFKVKIFKNAEHFYLHWTLEPKKINFALSKGKYYASFELVLRMEDLQGNLVLEKEEEIPLEISPEDYKQHERQLFAFQDILPLIPGNFKFFFLLKSKTAKDFTSFQTEVSVPHDSASPLLSNLILYHGREKLAENQKARLKAFTFEGNQYVINAQNNFLPQEEMGLYCQLYNFKEDNGSLMVEIFSMGSDSPVQSYKKPLKEVLAPDQSGVDTGPLSLSTLKPGYYRILASIIDQNETKLLSERENFILLSQAYPVIPWIYSKLHNPSPDPDELYLFASQYFMTREYILARTSLEQALKLKDTANIRLLLAKTLYALRQYKDSLAIVFPVFQATQEREAAKVIAVNYAGLEDWSSALVYLEKLMEQATEISVLNLAAECYLNLNQPEKALPLLQKSLELNPNQDKIKELEKKARKLREQKTGFSHL